MHLLYDKKPYRSEKLSSAILLHDRLYRANLGTCHAESTGIVPNYSVSQEQVHSHRAGTGGCLCAETETSESCTLPPGVRDWAGREAIRPERKCCVTRGSTQTKILSSWEQRIAGWEGFKGRTSEMFCPRKGMFKCSHL